MSRPKYERGSTRADAVFVRGIAVRIVGQELAVRQPATIVRTQPLAETQRFERHAQPVKKAKKKRKEWPVLLLFMLLKLSPWICTVLAGLWLIVRNT